MTKSAYQPNKLLCLVAVLATVILFRPRAQASTQDEKAINNNLSYFLDNFKFSVGIGSSESALSIKNIQADLNFGYYFYKYTQPQQERIVNDPFKEDVHNQNTILTKSFFSLEVGAKYPERRFIRHSGLPTIEEQLFVIPLTLRWTRPDFFVGYTYQTFSLGYNVKGLLASHQLQGDKTLTPISCKDVTSFFHSLSVGTSIVATYGVYLGLSVDFPLNSSNGLDAYYPSSSQENNGIKPSQKGIMMLLHVGLDITMLLKKLYGVPFE